MRGRPPVTRARLLNYIASHKPRTIAQVARATGVDRSYVYRALRAAFGPHFRLQPDLPAGVGAEKIALPELCHITQAKKAA